MPTNVPPSPPISAARRRIAPCSVAYPTSRSSRCCGSIALPSAALSPNAIASNRSMPITKPPCDAHAFCVELSVAASATTTPSTHRALGTLPTASPHAVASARRGCSSSALHPPGHRPTIAPTTSCSSLPLAEEDDGGRAPASANALASPPVATQAASSTWLVIDRAVGCSNTSVGESADPTSVRSRDDSSVAASESTPASISGVSAPIEAAGAPVSSRTTRSTLASISA